MGDPSEGAELTPTSGEGQCEMRVCDTDGEPRCHVAEPTGHVCLARLRTVTRPQPLSMETLQGVRDGLERCRELGEELGSCLDLALENFRREPRCVQENARLLIRWGGGELEFISGQGQCEISVLLADGEPQYHITALGGDRPVIWSHTSPEPLSVTDLARVRDRLECWGERGEELSSCFGEAISQFSREPPWVQENARLRLCWDRGSLEFLSGEGQYIFTVSYQEGNPRYHFHVETLPVRLYVTRLRSRNDPLSANSLFKFYTELGLCRGDTAVLKACLYRAWREFGREPRCVQENARLLIRWSQGELEFIAGQGQCEVSVSCSTGEPQYHITERTWDVFLAWAQSHPELLKIKNLERVRNRLGRWGALGEELSGCFEEAISQFGREPPCVQGNTRMRLCWDRGSLEFLSGRGHYEISVSYQEGNPRYHFHVETLPVHLYVARLRSRKDPLSADSLFRYYSEVGLCRGDTTALRRRLHKAWDGFHQEPQYVQDNARLLIQWGRRQLRFTSGNGECEISVRCVDGEPQYHVRRIPVHVYLAQLRAHQQSLSADTLQRVLSELGSCHGDTDVLATCFDQAWQGFRQEPQCVQENARLVIPWDGQELEFVSGQGQCEISVLRADGEPQYRITALGGDRPVTWSHASPEPLSVADLVRVWDRLGRWGALGEELSSCFGEAISQFSREPPCVQENARMRIRWDGGTLELLSGEGQCEISVCCRDGRPQYEVGELPVHMYVARLRTHPEPLSADTLQRVLRTLGSCQGDTFILRTCIAHTLDRFVQEPQCVQENARLLIRWGGGELEFISGQGQCEISVLLADGEPQYHITELGGDRPVTWSHTSPEPLSVADLARVRDRLEHWGALGEGLSGCFGEAISQFSREPPCVQENARLRLCWDRGSLQFLSGQGQYTFSISYQEGNPRYHFHVETLPVHLFVARLRSRNDPLSAGSLFRYYSELGLCRGDTAALRSRLHKAWQGFRQEPQYVQDNARLLIQWGRRQLRFTSGNGECEISVRCGDGEPQYNAVKIPVHVYLAQLRTHPQPLSTDTLQRVLRELGSCHGDTDALTTCFDRAWEGFSREPRCVQENARLLIRWGRGELEFISGQGQCEISVLLADGEPQYHITELRGDRPVTWSHTSPEPLSVTDLVRVRDRLGHWGALGEGLSGCFGEAISQFSREPRCVQENVRMRMKWGGGELEFIAGQGQCEISVLLANGEPQYHITVLGGDRPVTWSHTSPEPLSVADLVRVRDRLGRWGALGEGLSSCFGEAISQFSQEPPWVQGNARMRIRWDGGTLELLSGEGQCEISVCCRDGRPQYEVGELPVHMYVARLCTHPEPLSADTLQRVLRNLGSCQEDTFILRACIAHALDRFVQEPRCVQENARLLIRWDRGELEFVSGQGQCEISVLLADGEPQYHITALGGDRPVTWSHTSPEPLSIADLARVWDRLGHWMALGEGLSGCFREAISQFSQEPPCVQGNARMRIYCDRNRLEFLSGEGQCEISVRYRNRRAQYEAGELPGHIHSVQLHTVSEPENQPPVTPHD